MENNTYDRIIVELQKDGNSVGSAIMDKKDIDSVLFRVGKSVRTSDKGRVISTVFDQDQLYSITQSDVEVR